MLSHMLQNPHIAYVSTYNWVFEIAFAEIMPHMRKFSYLRTSPHMHAIAFFRKLQTVKCTITRHTIQYRVFIKDQWVPYRHLLGRTVSLIQIQCIRGVARISVWWGHRSSAKGAIIEAPRGEKGGTGCPLPLGVRSGERYAPSPEFFLKFLYQSSKFSGILGSN